MYSPLMYFNLLLSMVKCTFACKKVGQVSKIHHVEDPIKYMLINDPIS